MSFLDNVRQWFRNIVHHPDYIEVEVEKNDTLWAICREASGATTNAEIQKHVNEVIALNPDMNPNMIHPGEKIRLPSDWG